MHVLPDFVDTIPARPSVAVRPTAERAFVRAAVKIKSRIAELKAADGGARYLGADDMADLRVDATGWLADAMDELVPGLGREVFAQLYPLPVRHRDALVTGTELGRRPDPRAARSTPDVLR